MNKRIVWHKELHTYREGDVFYIEFNTGHPDVVDKGEVGDIGLELDVTDGVTNV